jgi:hypothetical protein
VSVCQDHRLPRGICQSHIGVLGFDNPVRSAATLKDIGTAAAAEGVVSSIASDNIVVGIANQGIVVTPASDVFDVAQSTRVCRCPKTKIYRDWGVVRRVVEGVSASPTVYRATNAYAVAEYECIIARAACQVLEGEKPSVPLIFPVLRR